MDGRAYIIGAGSPSRDVLTKIKTSGAPVICADGGADYAREARIRPRYVVGDMDSISGESRAWAEREGAESIIHPADKDASDLELAIEFAREKGFDKLILTCVLGSRPDHTMTNLFLPLRSRYRAMNISVRENGLRALALNPGTTIMHGAPGDLFSILPAGSPLPGFSLAGAKWELHDDTLELGSTRSLSNVFIGRTVTVSLKSGSALFVHFTNDLALI